MSKTTEQRRQEYRARRRLESSPDADRRRLANDRDAVEKIAKKARKRDKARRQAAANQAEALEKIATATDQQATATQAIATSISSLAASIDSFSKEYKAAYRGPTTPGSGGKGQS